MMKDKNKNIQGASLLGFGYLKLVTDPKTRVEDCMVLDVSPALENLMNLPRNQLIGRKVSEILRAKDSKDFDWNAYFIRSVKSSKMQETVQWADNPGRYLRVTVIPTDKEHFAINLRFGEQPTAYFNEFAPTELKTFDIIFNSTNDAVSLLECRDGKYRYLRNNAIHQEYTGFKDVDGRPLADVVGTDVAENISMHFDRALATGRTVKYEQEFKFAPGNRLWQTRVTPIIHEQGNFILCSSEDTSELRKTRREKETLTRRMSAMFNQHSAVKIIFDPVSGEIVEANPAACKFYGYTRETLIGAKMQDINNLSADILGGKLLDGQDYFSALPYRMKGGETRFLDIYPCYFTDGSRDLVYSIIFDSTDRERYRNELHREKEFLRTTLKSIGDGVVTTDKIGRITSLNSVGQEISGWSEDGANGKLFTEVFRLLNEETGESVLSPIQEVLDTGRIVGLANHTVLLNYYGKPVPIADSAAPIKSKSGEILGVVMVFRDVSNEKEYRKKIEFLSYRDPLTGLYNRRYLDQVMNSRDNRENLPISIIMGDVNGLKLTNDVFGHSAGDSLLKSVADLLKENCRNDHLVARWGGDEFVIFMPNTSLKEAEIIISNINNAKVYVSESSLSLSLSMGCAVKETMSTSLQTVMRESEEYMYRQKLLDGKSYRNAIINTLLATLYEKSFETEEHSKRIEKYCHTMGRSLRLSAKEMNELSLLALLHDIGKVSIEQNILRKPGPLTLEEWTEMQRHPEIGYRIAQATPELAMISDLILSHHEHWDGRGYPHGIKGEEIPLACRILAIADSFDAMTSNRAYRGAMSIEEAIEEIRRNSGTQFDPELAALFIQNFDVE